MLMHRHPERSSAWQARPPWIKMQVACSMFSMVEDFPISHSAMLPVIHQAARTLTSHLVVT